MALEADSNHLMGEGQSTVRPPFFVGDNYAYWNTRMKLFIKASDYEVWRIILNGLIIPKKKVGDQEVVKEEEEWDANDLNQFNLMQKRCIHFFVHWELMSTIESLFVRMPRKYGINFKSLMKEHIA